MQETLIEQSPASSNNLPVLYKSVNFQPVDQNPIQQAIQLWATLSDTDTAVTYQKAAGRTWLIIKQVMTVILFLLSLVTALIIWVLGIAFQSGQHFRNWLEVKQPNLDEIVSVLFKFLVWPLERAYEWSATFVKEYLGWEIKFSPPTTESPANKPEDTTAIHE